MHDKSRRSLLKTISVGGVATISVPAKWSKPAVESVILPAHAQTTLGNALTAAECPAVVDSDKVSISVTALQSAPDLDGVRISFDGCTQLWLNTADDPTFNPDRIAFLDVDASENDTFDIEYTTGGNWELDDHNFSEDPSFGLSDEPEGSYWFDVIRLEGPYANTLWRISFDVAVTANAPVSNTMTLTNVKATQM